MSTIAGGLHPLGPQQTPKFVWVPQNMYIYECCLVSNVVLTSRTIFEVLDHPFSSFTTQNSIKVGAKKTAELNFFITPFHAIKSVLVFRNLNFYYFFGLFGMKSIAERKNFCFKRKGLSYFVWLLNNPHKNTYFVGTHKNFGDSWGSNSWSLPESVRGAVPLYCRFALYSFR